MELTVSPSQARESPEPPQTRLAGHCDIRDVAKVAGVSIGTVSHVLNHPERVRPLIRIRVQAVIKELDYSPNTAARELRLGARNNKTRTTNDKNSDGDAPTSRS